MSKLHVRRVFLKMAFNCMFLAIICKMLYQVNQNNTLRLLGYGLQLLVVACYIVQEMVTIRKKAINVTIVSLSLLVFFQSLVTIWTHSFYIPYAPIDIWMWPLSFIVYYNYSYQRDIVGIVKNKTIWYYFVICVISVPLLVIHLSGAGNMGQVIFPTYFCITSLPLVLLFTENKFCKKLSMVLAVIVLVTSTKRAGTIALLMGLLVMSLVDAHIQGSLKVKWKKYFWIFVLLFAGIVFVVYLDSNSNILILDRFVRLGIDKGSGRSVIWGIVVDAYRASDLWERLFGHGFQSVYYVLKPEGLPRFAHNSYIEYLYDYGIVGMCLLIIFFVLLLKSGYRMIKQKSKFAPIMSMLLVMTAFLSVFSYFFEESNIIMPIAVAYGVILGLEKKERRLKYEI